MSTRSLLRLGSSRIATSPLSSTSCPARKWPVMSRSIGAVTPCSSFSTTTRRSYAAHTEETFDEFNARYEKEFDGVQDIFELQRNLNNAFAYDLVPSPSVIVAALKAARRVNDFPTAVRVFEAIKQKVENRNQYNEYLEELKELREELGVPLKEDMFPDEK